MSKTLPKWADLVLIPAINVLLAFFVAGLVVIFIGEDPVHAMQIMIRGSLGSDYGIGYTLYYTTSFIFTGLAVAVAFHAMIFNIGGEGQAGIAGVGVAIVALSLDHTHWLLTLPLAVIAAALFGAAWAAIPAYLQAKRGSHIVITTIMFNFIASALMVYLLVNVLIDPGQMSPETREFRASAALPYVHELLRAAGVPLATSPLNLAFVLALLCCGGVWIVLWRTRLGYAIRTVGFNPSAAIYAGIDPARTVILAMSISGALAGLVGVNEILGVQRRLLLDFVAGYGFTGIAVSLMGRNHPLGIILAALLFGALFQGGAELSFEMPTITREMVVVIQGLTILFCGALEFMTRPYVENLYRRLAS